MPQVSPCTLLHIAAVISLTLESFVTAEMHTAFPNPPQLMTGTKRELKV